MDIGELAWKVPYLLIGFTTAFVSLQIASEGPRRTWPSERLQKAMYFVLFPVSACTGFQAPAFFFCDDPHAATHHPIIRLLGKLVYVFTVTATWPLKVGWNVVMIVAIGLVYAWGGLRQSFKQLQLKRRGFYLPR